MTFSRGRLNLDIKNAEFDLCWVESIPCGGGGCGSCKQMHTPAQQQQQQQRLRPTGAIPTGGGCCTPSGCQQRSSASQQQQPSQMHAPTSTPSIISEDGGQNYYHLDAQGIPRQGMGAADPSRSKRNSQDLRSQNMSLESVGFFDQHNQQIVGAPGSARPAHPMPGQRPPLPPATAPPAISLHQPQGPPPFNPSASLPPPASSTPVAQNIQGRYIETPVHSAGYAPANPHLVTPSGTVHTATQTSGSLDGTAGDTIKEIRVRATGADQQACVSRIEDMLRLILQDLEQFGISLHNSTRNQEGASVGSNLHPSYMASPPPPGGAGGTGGLGACTGTPGGRGNFYL